MPGAPETSLQFGWGHARGRGVGARKGGRHRGRAKGSGWEPVRARTRQTVELRGQGGVRERRH